MIDKNPYRTLHARMSPPGAAWDEGFAAGQSQAWDSAQVEIDAILASEARPASVGRVVAFLREPRDSTDVNLSLAVAADLIEREFAAGRAAATPPLHGTGYCPQPCPECAAATPDPPDGFRVTVYSGQSATDERPAAVSTRYAGATDLHDVLRRIGLEWKQADYMGQRQVVVTVDPVAHAASPDERLREAERAALIESIAQTERFRGGPCLCSGCVEKRADAEAVVDAVLAALAAADRGTACTDRENAGVGGAVTRGIVPSGTDDPAAADREKPEER